MFALISRTSSVGGKFARWRRLVWVLVAALVLGGLALVFWPRPRLAGHTVAQWRDIWYHDPERVKAAFTQAGPEDLAFLVEALHARPSWRDRFFGAIHRNSGQPWFPLPRTSLVRLPLPQGANGQLQEYAFASLATLGPRLAPAVPALQALMDDSAAQVRARALQVLGRAGEAARPAVPRLLQATRDADPSTRAEALVILFRLAPKDPAVWQAAHARLQDADTSLRLEAARALWENERQAEGLVPALRELLTMKPPGQHFGVLLLLTRMGPAAAAAAPAVTKTLKDPRTEIRALAVSTLLSIAGAAPETRAALQQCLADPAATVRLRAEAALRQLNGQSGSRPEGAAPRL